MKKLKIFSLIFALVTLFTSCEEQPIIGIGKGHVETKEASEITTTSAKLNGEVIRKGGASDYSIGFLLYLGYLEEDFTLETDVVKQIQCDKSEGAFSKTIDNLTENRTYKFRSYITNEAGTNYGEVKTFITSFACLQTLTGHTHYVLSASYSPDGTKIVSASYDKTIKIWDSNSGECLQTLKGHKEGVCSAVWSKDGKRCFSAAWDDTFRIWDTISGECLQIITREYFVGIYYAIWSKDKKKI